MLANALVMRRDANLEFMKNDALTYLNSRKWWCYEEWLKKMKIQSMLTLLPNLEHPVASILMIDLAVCTERVLCATVAVQAKELACVVL